MNSDERQLEEELVEKLIDLKYEYRADIRDCAAVEKNFREKLGALNLVRLANVEFQGLDEIMMPGVFAAAHTPHSRNTFTRDDGTRRTSDIGIVRRWSRRNSRTRLRFNRVFDLTTLGEIR